MKNNRGAMEIEDKKRIASSDFDRLLKQGSIGFYNSCEITQVFLHDKISKVNTNFFSLACFSERSVSAIEERFLSPKLHSINSLTGMGIIQFTVPVDEAKVLFNHAQKGSFQINDKQSRLSKNLVLLPKQYVPQVWGTSEPFINKLLKPNFYGENYIVEFFDEEKGVLANLERAEVEKIFCFVKDCADISIDLSSVYDRVGGLIFQFPITVLTCDCRLLANSNSVRLNFNRHLECNGAELIIACKTSLDDVVTGFRTTVCSATDRTAELEIGDSDNLELFVSLKYSGLLLHHTKMQFCREIRMNMNWSTAHAKPRTILTSDSKNPVELHITSSLPMHIGRRQKREYRDYIRRRTQENEIISYSGDYLVLQKGERTEALAFIRKKLRSVSELREIVLWDPYLSVQDIVDTLYFETTGVPFKCITSLKGLKKMSPFDIDDISDGLDEEEQVPVTFETAKKHQRDLIQKLSNNLGVRIEFRCQHNHYGYPFHDRFLILIPNDEEILPVVYSLGSSVNSLGKLHHLIQKVTNPRVILNNFNSLWNDLHPEQCRVFLLPGDLRSQEQ
ncbi:MAG: VPA1262 family N-terminal domain-containing protein [Pseudomonadota bacterium]